MLTHIENEHITGQNVQMNLPGTLMRLLIDFLNSHHYVIVSGELIAYQVSMFKMTPEMVYFSCIHSEF